MSKIQYTILYYLTKRTKSFNLVQKRRPQWLLRRSPPLLFCNTEAWKRPKLCPRPPKLHFWTCASRRTPRRHRTRREGWGFLVFLQVDGWWRGLCLWSSRNSICPYSNIWFLSSYVSFLNNKDNYLSRLAVGLWSSFGDCRRGRLCSSWCCIVHLVLYEVFEVKIKVLDFHVHKQVFELILSSSGDNGNYMTQKIVELELLEQA